MKQLFGTFGVRRIANTVLTPEFASKIVAAYGTKVKGTIAIGSDPQHYILLIIILPLLHV